MSALLEVFKLISYLLSFISISVIGLNDATDPGSVIMITYSLGYSPGLAMLSGTLRSDLVSESWDGTI